jgi:hypothetical protein
MLFGITCITIQCFEQYQRKQGALAYPLIWAAQIGSSEMATVSKPQDT